MIIQFFLNWKTVLKKSKSIWFSKLFNAPRMEFMQKKRMKEKSSKVSLRNICSMSTLRLNSNLEKLIISFSKFIQLTSFLKDQYNYWHYQNWMMFWLNNVNKSSLTKLYRSTFLINMVVLWKRDFSTHNRCQFRWFSKCLRVSKAQQQYRKSQKKANSNLPLK